jgi:mannose-6-phosphate isomerase-like protein (cupin superfamily)
MLPVRIDARILRLARASRAFRRVLLTTPTHQLVAMSIPPGGEIGLEAHPKITQRFIVLHGRGMFEIGNRGIPGQQLALHVVTDGATIITVPMNTAHNVRNVGRDPLQLLTIYTPPNHLPDRLHRTKAEADGDMADEAYGRRVGGVARRRRQ